MKCRNIISNKVMVIVSCLFLMISCGGPADHIDLPDNNLSFPVEGGTIVYSSKYDFEFDGFIIDGKKVMFAEAVEEGGKCIGVKADWVSFIYPKSYVKSPYEYEIIVQPNLSGQSRTAEIRLASAHSDCELYVHQAGK